MSTYLLIFYFRSVNFLDMMQRSAKIHKITAEGHYAKNI